MRSSLALVAVALTCAAITVGPGVAAQTLAPRGVTQVKNCLDRHRLLTFTTTVRIVPKGMPQVGALQFSFSIVAGEAQNNGYIAFERDASTAQRVGAAFLKTRLAYYKQQGLTVTPALVKTGYFIQNNALVFWNNDLGVRPPGRTKARSTLVACLG